MGLSLLLTSWIASQYVSFLVVLSSSLTFALQTSSNAPSAFKCDIQPRSPQHADTIRRDFLAATSTMALFEQEADESDKVFMREAKLAAEQAISS